MLQSIVLVYALQLELQVCSSINHLQIFLKDQASRLELGATFIMINTGFKKMDELRAFILLF